MGVAYYICLDRGNLEAATTVDGKALGRAANDLHKICDELGLRSIDEFVGMSADDVERLVDEKINVLGKQREPMWFTPDEGIACFSKLVEYLRSNPKFIADTSAVVQDLEDLIKTLVRANTAGARWHLAIVI